MRLSWILSLLISLPVAVGAQSAVNGDLAWSSQDVALSTDVRIEADPSNAAREFLHLPDGERVVLENALDPKSKAAAIHQTLSDTERTELRRIRQDLVVAIARMAIAKRLTSVSIVSGEKARHLAPNEDSLQQKNLTPLNLMADVLSVGGEEPAKQVGKLKTFLKFVNEAILLSTYQAGKDFVANRGELKGRTNEFGLQITLKAEFQFGMGKINITKNFPFVLSLGYKRDTRQILIRVGRRSESMTGGTAFSAGLKVEVRKYSMISTSAEPQRLTVEGVSWYPPSIPMMSLVADTSHTYRSMGMVFGVNLADLIPGMYFVNTVNGFSEKDIFLGSIRLPSMPAWIGKTATELNRWTKRSSPVLSCEAVFAI
jgi:hypothetical protein